MLDLPMSPSSMYSNSDIDINSSMGGSDDREGSMDHPPKKRRVRLNLSHMSMEEKLDRRKMKNRVAAQNARDRRKDKMEQMGNRIAQLSEERIKMIRENDRLRKQMKSLEAENQELKQRLENSMSSGSPMPLTPASINNCEQFEDLATVTAGEVSSFGSAAEARTINFAVTAVMSSNGQQLHDQQQGEGGTSGVGRRGVSLDDAIRMLVASPGEPDEILEWLEKCSKNILGDDANGPAQDGSNYQLDGKHERGGSGTNAEQTAPGTEDQLFGQLQSVRDLITFDHRYYQTQKEETNVDDMDLFDADLFPQLY